MKAAAQRTPNKRRSGSAIRWVRVLTALSLAVAGVLMHLSITSSESSTAGLGYFSLAVIWSGILSVGIVAEVILREPRRAQPLLFASTILPAFAAVGAIAVPEALQHHFRSSFDPATLHEVSLYPVPLALVAGLLLATGYGCRWRRRLIVAATATVGALLGRVLLLAFFGPGWWPGLPL